MCKNLDGENLMNFWSVVNFAKFLQHQSFPPYSIVEDAVVVEDSEEVTLHGSIRGYHIAI